MTWLALGLLFAIDVLMRRTRLGLRLRAVGEKPQAVAAMGISASSA